MGQRGQTSGRSSLPRARLAGSLAVKVRGRNDVAY